MGALWARSGTTEFYQGEEAAGALAYFFEGNTTTPLTVYEDAAETTPRTHPFAADANGRLPITFIPFIASYDVKVTTAGGTQLYYYRGIPNPNPVEEAEAAVDDTQLLQTGDVLWSPVDATRTGMVRLNGRTVGSASSGATERANADCEDLFLFLWNNLADAQAAVSGGRGASAAADWAANKTIALLDGRHAVLAGLADMGNSDSSGFAGATFVNGDGITQGSIVGSNTFTVTSTYIPAHTHSVSITTSSDNEHNHTGTTAEESAHTHSGTSSSNGAHTHFTVSNDNAATALTNTNAVAIVDTEIAGDTNYVLRSSGSANATRGLTDAHAGHTHTMTTGAGTAHNHAFTASTQAAHSHTVSGNTGSTGTGTALPIVQKSVLGTYYQKL